MVTSSEKVVIGSGRKWHGYASNRLLQIVSVCKANPGSPGKMAVKMDRERERERESW